MCGILAVHGLEKPSSDRAHVLALSRRLRHRGPDWSGCFVGQDCVLTHERLAIVGVGQYLITLYPFLHSTCPRVRCSAPHKPGRQNHPYCQRRDLQSRRLACKRRTGCNFQNPLRLRSHHSTGTSTSIFSGFVPAEQVFSSVSKTW